MVLIKAHQIQCIFNTNQKYFARIAHKHIIQHNGNWKVVELIPPTSRNYVSCQQNDKNDHNNRNNHSNENTSNDASQFPRTSLSVEHV